MPDVPTSFRQDWTRLWNLAERLTTAHPHSDVFSDPEDPSTVLGFAGLFLEPPDDPGDGWSEYVNSPRNAITFGSTGVDGVHFCALFGPADAPTTTIVLCVPLADEPNHVVGTSLAEFLALGCRTGYHLDPLAYDFRETMIEELQAQQLSEEPERVFLLEALTEEFNLGPWPDVAPRLAELKTQYAADIAWTPYPTLG
ncbi:hypothetical protein [Kribbella italica]|uniref:Uncharacterized protein n=1 Tax=Kribbella italica TaxID=1540520 RepID=A0A7W9J8Y4_9ACTN|nr:hypothetical protein [Kribbella italica]MBB5837575.1 hypothetical protein [Kribbella italica]